MPVYEYECGICNFRFEQRQRIEEERVAACPLCQGKARRVFCSVPILFRGSGFYVTDHGRGNPGDGGKETGTTGGEEK